MCNKKYISRETIKLGSYTFDVFKEGYDKNGNPRFVIHYLDLHSDYQKALKASRIVGGCVYRKKWFGGGIVFQSYNVRKSLERIVSELNR